MTKEVQPWVLRWLDKIWLYTTSYPPNEETTSATEIAEKQFTCQKSLIGFSELLESSLHFIPFTRQSPTDFSPENVVMFHSTGDTGCRVQWIWTDNGMLMRACSIRTCNISTEFDQ